MNTYREHSKYSPSKIAILEKCSRFVSDDKTSEIAQRGTDIGEAIANALMGLEVPEDIYNTDAFQYGLGIIRDVIEMHSLQDWTISPERQLHIIPPIIWGYADIVISNDSDNSIAYLFEIKSGYANDREPADSNIQLKAYALGLLNEGYQQVKAYLIELDKQQTSIDTLTAQDKQRVKDRISKILEDTVKSATTAPGSYCNYCANLLMCNEFIESLPAVVDSINTELEPKEFAKSLSPASLSQILKHVLPLFSKAEKYVNELKARAIALLENNIEVPGFKIKVSTAGRQWIDESEAIWRITDICEKAQIMQLKSVSQVEKELKNAGVKKKDIDALLTDLTTRSERKQLVEG